MEYVRKQFNTLKERILEPRKFMQVLAGPRQVGKSTLVGQVLTQVSISHTVEVADAVDPKDSDWIHRIWEAARTTMMLRGIKEHLLAIEVKSGRRGMNAGLPAFVEAFGPKRSFVVGTGGVSLEDFLGCEVEMII